MLNIAMYICASNVLNVVKSVQFRTHTNHHFTVMHVMSCTLYNDVHLAVCVVNRIAFNVEQCLKPEQCHFVTLISSWCYSETLKLFNFEFRSVKFRLDITTLQPVHTYIVCSKLFFFKALAVSGY